jgi:hypothetical protein
LCDMSYPSHPPWPDLSNYTWWSVQVMKLLIMQFSPNYRFCLTFKGLHNIVSLETEPSIILIFV